MALEGDLSSAFDTPIGVKQGCPASPKLFSLYMDRLEAHIHNVIGIQDDKAKWEVRVAGVNLLLLLFADDLVLTSASFKSMQGLLNTLHSFCRKNAMVVSTKKTKWLKQKGSNRASNESNKVTPLYYDGIELE